MFFRQNTQGHPNNLQQWQWRIHFFERINKIKLAQSGFVLSHYFHQGYLCLPHLLSILAVYLTGVSFSKGPSGLHRSSSSRE